MKILVTGGSGFLGRTMILGHPEHSYVVYSPNVYNQQSLHTAAKKYAPDTHIQYVVGDIREQQLLQSSTYGCQAIIHMGAMKYVPEAEHNVGMSVSVNVNGSQNVMTAAFMADVKSVVAVSTDKACMPVSVYGATKLLMERMFINAGLGKNIFHSVRFGNFIGSTGSVIPKLLDQARMTGTITITDMLMTRYWMRAADVGNILIALAEGKVTGLKNGSVLVPDPPAMTMSGIVKVIQTLTSDRLKIDTIGPRPGEKTHELLLCHEETAHVLAHVAQGPFKDGFYEYHPDFGNSETFKLISSSPREWLDADTMIEYVREAQQVQAASVV